MLKIGTFKGWITQKSYGFIRVPDQAADVFVHMSEFNNPTLVSAGTTLSFNELQTDIGTKAVNLKILNAPTYPQLPFTDEHNLNNGTSSAIIDESMLSENIEETNTNIVQNDLLTEIARWKRDAKGENTQRYFFHVREVDQISRGEKNYVIGRKGSGKTAICQHFDNIETHDIFSEKLSFKNFPFNELYEHKNPKFTTPNQFITLWKYLIYSTVCRLMLKNQALDASLRSELSKLYDGDKTLNRRVGEWTSKEFGFSLFGFSSKFLKNPANTEPTNWVAYVDYLEDLLLQQTDACTYFVLFDELDEDYQDIIGKDRYTQYTSLITSLFKAVQDIRSIFETRSNLKLYPVIFLRDDIYDLITDSDKNKWGDFRVDLNWDFEKIKRLLAFRISRAIDTNCTSPLSFESAWERVFGQRKIGVGTKGNSKISTFDFICRSTLSRPRDFVEYLQNCANHAVDTSVLITPPVVRHVDKAFSNYLRQELTDELFAILPDISNIMDTISQLRKWNFSIPEFERAYQSRVEQGFIQEKNVKFVIQVLYLFSVIGNSPRTGRYVFRYQNREARLNFNERVVVHRGLFKALQIL